jgi:hypothetical protein
MNNLNAALCDRSQLPAYSCWHCCGFDTPEHNAFADALEGPGGSVAPSRVEHGSIKLPAALTDFNLALLADALAINGN